MKQSDEFYKSSRWRHLRSVILRRDGYMCQASRRYGKRVPADTVHHIFPREEFPEYQWQPWNLISLSADAHNRMHDRVTNALTKEGLELMRRTARRQGIKAQETDGMEDGTMEETRNAGRILVCGYPGTGKSTWVREHLGDGLAYDLDAIAAAFRLRAAHEERHEASRRMANDLLHGFLHSVDEYTDSDVYVIRTAPGMEELEEIAPDRVVMLLERHVKRNESADARERLQSVAEWCEANDVPVSYE